MAAYIEALGGNFEKPTVKQHLAAIRMLFDWLVTGQVVPSNPAHAVRGPRHSVHKGSTTVMSSEDTSAFLKSIDASHVVGLRDRAFIAVMVYAFARVSAVVGLKATSRGTALVLLWSWLSRVPMCAPSPPWTWSSTRFWFR